MPEHRLAKTRRAYEPSFADVWNAEREAFRRRAGYPAPVEYAANYKRAIAAYDRAFADIDKHESGYGHGV